MTRAARSLPTLLAAAAVALAEAQLGCRFDADREGDAASNPRERVCRSDRLTLNAGSTKQDSTCRPTLCSLGSSGSIEMSYCVGAGDGSWASCTAGTGKDLNGFDADNGGEGLLEVVFCVDAPPEAPVYGSLNLWYGSHPKRKYVPLLPATSDGGRAMKSGCRTAYFTPAMACFSSFDPNASDALPTTCNYQCGATTPECRLDFGEAPLTLTAEWAEVGSSASVRLLSVAHLSSGCLCGRELACGAGERPVCSAGALPVGACPGGDEGCGVCAAGGTSDCGDLVGRYADGWHAGASDAFASGFLSHYPLLGCPFENGGTPYVHEVRGVELQDFRQSDLDRRISPDGESALLLGPGRDKAFLVYGEFWGIYRCLRDQAGAMGGAALLGAPISERRLVREAVRQDFQRGWLLGSPELVGEDSVLAVTVHLSSHAELAPGATTGCAPAAAIENPE